MVGELRYGEVQHSHTSIGQGPRREDLSPACVSYVQG